MRTFCWVVALLGALVGGLMLAGALLGLGGREAQLTQAAVACACALVPGAFARAVSELEAPRQRKPTGPSGTDPNLKIPSSWMR